MRAVFLNKYIYYRSKSIYTLKMYMGEPAYLVGRLSKQVKSTCLSPKPSSCSFLAV